MSFTAMRPEDYFKQEAMGREPVEIWATVPSVADVRACMRLEVSKAVSDAQIMFARDHMAVRYHLVQGSSRFFYVVAYRTAAVFDETRTAKADAEERGLAPPFVF